MAFKTISTADASRVGALPVDYEWDTLIGNTFVAAREDSNPRLSQALEALNIYGAADVYLGAAEWCLARVQQNMPAEDGRLRLEAAWAATVDIRYCQVGEIAPIEVGPDDIWNLPEWRLRRSLTGYIGYLAQGRTAKLRQVALGMILMAEHICGRDPAIGPWLADMLRKKMASSPRRADDVDHKSRDTSPPTAQELTEPSRDKRLAGLDPTTNPYLRSAVDMAALGFVGNPYP